MAPPYDHDDDDMDADADYDDEEPNYSTIAKALLEHKDSLEKLTISDTAIPVAKELEFDEIDDKYYLGSLRELHKVRTMDVDLDCFGGIEVALDDDGDLELNDAGEVAMCISQPAELAECLPRNLEELTLNIRGKQFYTDALLRLYEQFALRSLEELATTVGTRLPALKEIDLGLLAFNGESIDRDLVKLREQRLRILREQFKQAGVELWWVKAEGEKF
jgi:hypothetical protein